MVNGITKSTRTDLAPKVAAVKLTPKQSCEAKGGRWDEVNQVCILPETPIKDTTIKPKVTEPLISTAPQDAKVDSTINGLNQVITEQPDVKPFGTPITGAVTGGGVITIDGRDFVVNPTQRKIIEQRINTLRLSGVKEKTASQLAREEIIADPTQFGFEVPMTEEEKRLREAGQQVDRPDLTGVVFSEREKAQIQTWREQVSPSMVDEFGNPLPQLILSDAEVLRLAGLQGSAQADLLLKGLVASSGLSNIGKVNRVWKVGEKFISNGKKAVQGGNAIKSSNKIKPLISIIKDVALISLAFGGKGTDLITRDSNAKQQALNTMGQETSTIVGDSKSGAGDVRLGLAELNRQEQVVLELERDIKGTGLKNVAYDLSKDKADILADVEDQLRTIDEGKRELQSFIIQGKFPSLTDFETQELLRELEEEGFIKPVDLTEVRRQTTKKPI